MINIKAKKIMSATMALLCSFALSAVTVFADSVVAEPEVKLPIAIEIQLGPKWAGVEFQLKTDDGLYPEGVPVGTNGVLRLSLSGGDKYILSCMDSAVSAPSPEETQALGTAEPEGTEAVKSGVQGSQGNDTLAGDPKEVTVGGIPVQHIILFGGGLLVAVGSLIVMYVLKKRRTGGSQSEDNDE